jgi:hypothetical protein
MARIGQRKKFKKYFKRVKTLFNTLRATEPLLQYVAAQRDLQGPCQVTRLSAT